MANKPLNSVDGFSVGANTIINVIDATGNVTANFITASSNVTVSGTLKSNNITLLGGNVDFTNSANIQFANITVNGNANVTTNLTVTSNITAGNANIGRDVIIGNAVLVGNNAPTAELNFPNSIILATANSANYAQASLLNQNPNASTDWVAYFDSGNAEAGYSDMGITGSTYSQPNTGLTQPGDGYFVVAGVSGFGGNLIIATAGTGDVNDIIFGNGYDTSNEVMRFSNPQQQFQIHPTTPATSTTTGALVVTGGAGIGLDLWVGGNIYGNLVGNITANIVIPGPNTGVVFNDDGNANSAIAFTFNKTSNLVTIAGNLSVGNITSITDITGTGNIVIGNVYANSGTIKASLVTGTLTTNAQPNITSVGTLTSLDVTGDVSASNVIASNVYANSGTIKASLLAGTLTTNAQPNITSVGTLTSLDVTGDVSASNVIASNVYANSGTIKATLLTGTLTTTNQPNITQVGLLSNLNVGNSTSNTVFGNGTITAAGAIQSNTTVYTNAVSSIATSGITITAAGTNSNINLVTNGTGNIILTANTNITGVAYTPINPGDAASKNYVDTVAQGLSVKDSVLLATATTLPAYTYNNGTFGVGATITANAVGALSIDSTAVTANARVLIKNEISSNAPYNGIYLVTNTGNATANFLLTRTLDFDSSSSNIPGSFTFVEEGTINQSTGWVCTTQPPVSVGSTDITFAQFSGAGTYTAGTGLTLTGSQFSITNTTVTTGTYGNGDAVATFTVNQQGQLTAASNTYITANAANLTGTTLASSIINSSLTSVGTLGNLAVTSNITAGNVYANSGTIGASLLIGTLTTNAQPNITSVGTLGNLDVTSNITAGNVYANSGTIQATLLTGTLTTNAQPNVTSVGLLSALTVGNTTSNTIFGNGTIDATSNIVGGNLSTGGQVVATGNVSGGNLSTGGTLSVTGNANVGNIGAASGVFTSNVTSGNIYANTGTIGASLLTGTLTTNAQPNITSVGTLSSLTVTGDTTTGNLYANTGNANIGNLTVNGTIIANVSVSKLVNGTSNVTVLASGNVTTSVAGNANIFTVNGIGANVAGQLNITSNLGSALTSAVNINSDGNYVAPQRPGIMLQITGHQDTTAVLLLDGVGVNNYAGFIGRHYDGTPSSPSGLGANEIITRYGANPYTTTGWPTLSTSRIDMVTEEVQTGSAQGSRTEFWITPAGTTTVTKELVINGNGVNVVSNLVSSNANITVGLTAGNLSTGGTLSVTGNANIGNLGTATAIITTGNITTINSGLLQNGSSNIAITASSNVTISSAGNAGVLTVTGTGANISGTANVTGNLYAANANILGIVYATSFVPSSLTVTTAPSGSTTLLANSASQLIVSGSYGWTVNLPLESTLILGQSYTINNNTTAGVIVKNNAGTALFTVPSGGITQFIYDGVSGTNNWDYHSFLPYTYSAGGNLLQLGNSTTEVDLSVYGNITAQTGYYFIGNGFNLTSTNGANVVGNVTSAITANYANYAGNVTIAAQSNITTLGTLGNLSVANNANVGNLLVNSNANIVGGLVVVGNISAANGNIIISGNSISVSNTISANYANIAGNVIAGNVQGGNLVSANYLVGNGVGITGLTLANSLSDVTISSPSLNQVIAYNGVNWVNQNQTTPTSAGSGVSFWFTDPTIIPNNANNYVELNTLNSTPNTSAVSYLTGNIPGSTTAVFGALESGALDRTQLDAGAWSYAIWANCNTVSGGSSTMTAVMHSVIPITGTITLTGTGTSRTATASTGSPFFGATGSSNPNVASYLQTPNALLQITAVSSNTVVTVTTLSTYVNESAVAASIWDELFNVGSASLTTTLAQYNFNTTQGVFTVPTTAKLGLLVTATNPRSSNTLVNITLNGTTTASSMTTPLITLHDNLAGLQGGQANEYFHMTQAEYTGSGTGIFIRQSNPVLIAPNIGDSTGSSLAVDANITAGNVYANSGTVIANLLTGTLTTNAQPNITSIGTLSSLTVTGNVTAGNLLGALANGNSNISIPSANGNIDITAAGNTTLVITGTGVNVFGTLNTTGNASVGNLYFGSGIVTGTGNIVAGNIIGTIAAGSNSITTNGNITGGNIIGIIAAGSNTITTTGNITGGNANLGNLVQANFATVTLTTTAANQSNITTVGTLTSLNVSGTSNLGPVSNVTITGGSTGQYLQTNGSGVLSWATLPSGNGIANGTSNVIIPASNGNVNIWTNGTQKWVFDTTGNLTTPAGILLDVNSNISNANIITANYLVASLGCVTVGTSTIFVSGSTAGLFNVGGIYDINIGLSANVELGSASGTVTINNTLSANGNIASNANITASGNITATNTVSAANVAVGNLYSSRTPVSVGIGTVIIDQFPLATYRSAKYTIKAGSDYGYQALEVLLIHDSINSIITVYGSLSTYGSDLVTLTSNIGSGNVQLYAQGLYANTVVNLLGIYVPD